MLETPVPCLISSLVRLARPWIMVSVLLSGYTGMVLGQGGFPGWFPTVISLFSLLVTSVGSVMMNGVMERDSDAIMVRLRQRGASLRRVGVAPTLVIGTTLVVAGVVSAWLLLNPLTGLILLGAVILYVPVYTLWLKRQLSHATVPGGIPGALPVLAGYAAARGALELDAALLFLIVFLWQPPHFWLLTLRHGDDYRQAGIPVPLVRHGTWYTILLIRAYVLSLLPATLSLWLFGFCSWRYAAAVTACWLPFAAVACSADRGDRLPAAFRLSIAYLTIVCLSIIIDRAFSVG